MRTHAYSWPRSVPQRKAAANRAVTKTFASVESGTIVTRTDAHGLDGRRQAGIKTTLKWNGEDIALRLSGTDGGGLLYVDGKYYETSKGKIVHFANGDTGDTGGSQSQGAMWVAAAKREVDGSRIARVIDVLKGLASTPQADGSTFYVGHATVGAIDAQFKDADGLPYIARPFMKVGDPATIVKVLIAVSADGVIRSLTAAYAWDNADWVYTAEYTDLGSAPEIPTPDSATVIESDGTRG